MFSDVVILARINNVYVTSYLLVINSNLGPVLHHFWDKT